MTSTRILRQGAVLLLTLAVTSHTVHGCSEPLGLMTGEVEDWQVAASSTLTSDPKCNTKYARLHGPNGKAWCAGYKREAEWLLIDLGVEATISSVMIQGRGDGKQWVTKFVLSYSDDAYTWKFTNDIYGKKKIFSANTDSHSLRHLYLDEPITARFVRIHVMEWHGHPSLRIELIGCQECRQLISVPPHAKVTASSSPRWRRKRSCQPEDGVIFSSSAWCSRHKNRNQWLQFDFGPPRKVTGIVTLGRGDGRRKRFVTQYSLSYSNNSVVWHFYKDDNHLDPKVFAGNMDTATERRHYLNQPFVASYIRLHPVDWRKQIAMRAGVLGCPNRGLCGPGYIRVNEGSPCMENLAYQRPTWVNDKRQSWKDWTYGNSKLAVDGDESHHLNKCAILDNYYVDNPVWMVDLGRRRKMNGVVLALWDGKGEDNSTQYRDYVLNLDKLSVYVSNKQHQVNVDARSSHKCDYVSRENGALFRPRLHVACPRELRGRYVYIKAYGVPNRWRKLFTAILCEVMVY
ncbi:lactadherin-like [Amphibalanus amphitrite]|uniref:lactadherin-like n=1 Tax=Amphibalanus amphitrite TaxID=1232801 RepID=UPI001C911DB3|nr:lactadherin-like [Amphibalanus amphitrite]